MALALAGLLGAAHAQATVVRQMSRQEMTATAQLVVRGRVLSVTPRYGPEGRRIFREVRLHPTEVVKGELQAGAELSMLAAGGTLGGVSMSPVGASRFAPGEDVVLFLERYAGEWIEIAIGYGKYQVVPDARGRKVVVRDVRVSEARWTADGRTVVGAPRREAPELLHDFLNEIRAYVRAEKSR